MSNIEGSVFEYGQRVKKSKFYCFKFVFENPTETKKSALHAMSVFSFRTKILK